MSTVYTFSARTLRGEVLGLERYRGKVLLIVNTASECGFTPQYAGLQRLHEQFAARGFEVLGFPCNQFGKQEPGDAAQIGSFCEKNFGVTFPMFEKVDVKGPGAHPLFGFLSAERRGIFGTKAIKWNFTKFLIGRDGTVLKRYGPKTPPEAITADIERLL
ncbi:glutathione peroxidase [Trinickia diaoshuihuensis]|uniref:glutathione peroxidase n=1 Tax=Trinickia diaoshuihuensis TaxID=2292265 RepID=UPI000E2590C1|nr:glutathione peroxidase [Trinickia diaoshuihuensis]